MIRFAEKQPLITVVVPVYNIEGYIGRCIDSILAQSYEKMEIILVDDGSTDKSGNICDDYESRDQRIQVIHKSNGGLSDARNIGIKAAKGNYITLIDGDDFVSARYVENLLDALVTTAADMASSWFINYFDGDKLPEAKEAEGLQVLGNSAYLEKLLYQNGADTSACGKLYKTEMLIKYPYPVGKLYEDIPVTYQVIKNCKRIALISNLDYFYFQRKNSIQYQRFSSRKLDSVKHIEELKKNVDKDFPQLHDAAVCRCFSVDCNILFQIPPTEENSKYISLLWRKIIAYRGTVIRDKNARKKAKAGALLSFWGYRMMAFIYHKTQYRG